MFRKLICAAPNGICKKISVGNSSIAGFTVCRAAQPLHRAMSLVIDRRGKKCVSFHFTQEASREMK
jgi:hypothetical protein